MEIVVEPRPRAHSTSDIDTHEVVPNPSIHGTPEVTLRQRRKMASQESYMGQGEDFVFLDLPDNEVEEHKMTQNYMFGFKKWKSHLTVRPLQERSDIVKQLYQEPKQIKPAKVSTITVGNILYLLLIGWVLALAYSIVSLIMFLTLIGKDHGIYCFKLARYFLWPFGYFLQEQTTYHLEENEQHIVHENDINHKGLDETEIDENTPLSITRPRQNYVKINTANYWKRPSTYVWLVLGVPLLFLVHGIIIFLTWFTVVLIPVCKLNIIAIKTLLLMPPEKLYIDKSSTAQHANGSEVIMCSYEAVNLYYYKYTVDGMNVILVNLLVFVVITLLLGYLDTHNDVVDTNVKFVMGLVAIIPLAYYIGMAIASISAQSTHAIGAVLNATFGSIVEIILYISALLKYEKNKGPCYEDLVQSALTGTLLATMLLVPGVCMIVGGIKHSEQRFNMKSAAVSASLLFISVAGAFTPTIFSNTYGSWMCMNCTSQMNENTSAETVSCLKCHNNVIEKDSTFYTHKVLPLIYICASLSLFAYVVGLVYTLKTHAHILEEHLHAIQRHQAKSIVHWGRIKSAVILLLSVVAMSLCAEVVVQNMEPILTESGVSEVFIGVTILAVVPDIPEIVNGVQFAMKNNISLSIDIGSSVAVQVCLLQIPVLVLANAIYPLHFHMVFNDIHLWSVIISVIIINFIFSDGKADYFQGTTLCVVYIIMLSMYYFAPNETKDEGCLDDLG